MASFTAEKIDDKCHQRDGLSNHELLSVIAGKHLGSIWLEPCDLPLTKALKCRRFFRLDHYKVVLVDQVRNYWLPTDAAAASLLDHQAIEVEGPIDISHEHQGNSCDPAKDL